LRLFSEGHSAVFFHFKAEMFAVPFAELVGIIRLKKNAPDAGDCFMPQL
jgi:hypothetical protein